MATTPAKKKSRAGQSRLDAIDSPIVVGEVVKKKQGALRGRPSLYTQELIDEICERISLGESLREITASNHMPDRVQILRWLKVHEDFRIQYARAKEDQADSYEDAMLHTARTEEDVQRARLIIDTMKWTASKLKPKKYGDKLDLTSDNKALPTPLLGSITIENNSPMTLGEPRNG